MAPMDKYTRLVGGAVHGLSCFHSAQCFFFFLLPLSSLGTMEVTVKRHVFHKCCHQTTPHVKGNGEIVMVFLVIVACFGLSLIRVLFSREVSVKSESDSLQSDASPILHHLPY